MNPAYQGFRSSISIRHARETSHTEEAESVSSSRTTIFLGIYMNLVERIKYKSLRL